MSSGYSGTPLAKKLGFKPGFRILLEGTPSNYAALVEPLPERVLFVEKPREPVDLIHLFTTRAAEMAKKLPRYRNQIKEDGIIWVSWPKKSAKVPTDITEDVVRREALRGELVDVKVCAVDEVWSGLKLVIRLKNRRKKIASGLGNR
jgi:hypothetical protein